MNNAWGNFLAFFARMETTLTPNSVAGALGDKKY
jgi:hypothetical protein